MFLTILRYMENFKKYYELIYKKIFIRENSSNYWLNKIDRRILEDYKLYHIV